MYKRQVWAIRVGSILLALLLGALVIAISGVNPFKAYGTIITGACGKKTDVYKRQGLSGEEGEVDNSVFDRYIEPLYKQASYKPYIIAAMIFMSQVKDPVRALMAMDEGTGKRKSF